MGNAAQRVEADRIDRQQIAEVDLDVMPRGDLSRQPFPQHEEIRDVSGGQTARDANQVSCGAFLDIKSTVHFQTHRKSHALPTVII